MIKPSILKIDNLKPELKLKNNPNAKPLNNKNAH